jgi:hypothetical protein
MYPFTRYHPSAGLYDSGSPVTISGQIHAMQYAKIQAGISSWWGIGSPSDQRMDALLSGATGTGFKWTVYYEKEAGSDPSVAELQSDLTYLRDHYGNNPSYLHVNGKFVVFVYASGADACGMADRWKAANTVGAYVVLKVFAGYRACASQPDSWHQYGPAVAADSQSGYSYAISPGFYKANEATARLARDLTRWNQNVRDMVASHASWQLITTLNEWGEGTSVESATEWASSSGYGAYLDALHSDGQGPIPPATGGTDATAPTAPSGVSLTGVTQTMASFAWTASTDNVGVTSYNLLLDGVAKGSAPTTSVTVGGLTCGTNHTFAVAALDAAGNVSTTSLPVVSFATSACSGTPPPVGGPCGTRATPPGRYAHVIWIVMENHAYSQVIGSASAPYENQLAGQCGLATNYKAVTHPSLPNYIAMTSGGTQGVTDDNPPSSHPLSAASIFSQVKAAGLTWRSYEEAMPSNCYLGSSGRYAVKHNPAAYFVPIRSDCAVWDVPMGTTSGGAFLNDLSANTLPAFSFVTPDMCNDTHDCGVGTGDSWLQGWIPKIVASPAYQSGNTAIVLTWDEDDFTTVNQVATIVISPTTTPGTRSATAFNHYSLLKTTEQMLGISTYLGHAGDAGTTSMRSAFNY